MASTTDWFSTAALAALGVAAGINVGRGTFLDWLRAKLMIDAAPPTFQAIPDLSGSVSGLDPATPLPDHPGGDTGARYADPVPSASLISGWGDCRSGITCSGSCCRKHKGVDLGAPRGTPVYSITAGRISAAGTGSGGCGLRVTLQHDDGNRSIYCHLDAIATGIRAGERIQGPGVPLGTVGDTGNAKGTTPHLHFEIHVDGSAVDPTNMIGR